MSIFKCKMCGGTIEFEPGATVGICDSCGTKQTLPRLDDDKRANLYDRANHFLRNNEFDKAAGIYEQILNEDNTDAEAYWSLVLCRYGIEYVEDPQTHKRVPTVNRAQFTSIYMDEDYKSALQYADGYQKTIYEEEAKAIDDIQKGILEISAKEEPFDVFICYKETDASGRRTQDSVLANDLYHQLTEEGFKVFFARITLEDKLGVAYEPYIFAALNSAKVMVAIGTKPEYFNAVWVKNEWSRYLALVKNSGGKKMLIPAYKDMDPYDLPEEFSHLQAQDMSKLGFMQDLIRGIKKIISADAPQAATVKETVIVGANNAATAPLLERVFLFLEDGKWKDANIYCEKVLDIDPKNAEAYLGKLLAELQVKNRKLLADCDEPFDDRDNFSKVIRFGDEKLEAEMRGYIAHINERNENARLTGIYDRAKDLMEHAQVEDYFKEAAKMFRSIPGFRDADSLAVRCDESAILARKESIYREACQNIEYKSYDLAIKLFNSILDYKDAGERIEACKKDAVYHNACQKMAWGTHYEEAISLFEQVRGWRDADDKIKECRERIAQKEAERIAEEKRAKQNKKIAMITVLILCAIVAFIIVLNAVIIPNGKYNDAIALLDAGNIVDGYEALIALNGYKDSAAMASAIVDKYLTEKLRDATAGERVSFGSYEQDNNTANGPEKIEWLVLTKEDGKVLLISDKALDCQPYNTSLVDITWETCSLRQWLNDSFLNAAFNSAEQAMIADTNVSADKNPQYSTNPGNATTDKVFLLSIDEVNRYFDGDEARKCIPTAYAIANGAWTNTNYTKGGAATCCWWLRSPGYLQLFAALVDLGGLVADSGTYVDDDVDGVRPALWINLGS